MATTLAEASAGQVTPKLMFGRLRFWLFMVGLVVILTGLLFGYDQGVISGALGFITRDFHLSTTLQEVVTSWVTLGALAGALLAGDRHHRLGGRGSNCLATLIAIAWMDEFGRKPLLYAGLIGMSGGAGRPDRDLPPARRDDRMSRGFH